MATITLTISDELLTRLKAGETTLALTATLRERKPRKSEPLPEHLRDAYTTVVELWAKYQPDVSPALAWKTLKGCFQPDSTASQSHALDAMKLALEWNEGRRYLPAWLVRDFGRWEYLASLGLFEQDEERMRYRQRFGLR
ncbi:hypothetical protein [Gemmatimonas sp.]|uniref:hypothetical protein n=1 Tax=Gemmatimonas sp. TaxID=1962908 RepID=UPI0025B9BC43|nr:hypothetical protein [Gemmatimonas sp.]MCA2991183.1 hypothetical protein [Gemmatimonas sp.]